MTTNTITVVGNLTADPELRFTQGGASVANFTIASTPRVYNKSTKEWEDGEALFLRATVWRDVAENVAESLSRGTRVIATGALKQRSFEDRDGNKRVSVELEVEEIGVSLRFAKVTSHRSSSNGSSSRSSSTDPWSSSDDAPF